MAELVMNAGWEAELARDIHPSMEHLATRMEEGAKRDCPAVTGHLRDSIYSEVSEDGTITVGATAHYAIDVEMGHDEVAWGHDEHRFKRPEPFLRPQVYKSWGDL